MVEKTQQAIHEERGTITPDELYEPHELKKLGKMLADVGWLKDAQFSRLVRENADDPDYVWAALEGWMNVVPPVEDFPLECSRSGPGAPETKAEKVANRSPSLYYGAIYDCLYKHPLEEMPCRIGHIFETAKIIAEWRLELGK